MGHSPYHQFISASWIDICWWYYNHLWCICYMKWPSSDHRYIGYFQYRILASMMVYHYHHNIIDLYNQFYHSVTSYTIHFEDNKWLPLLQMKCIMHWYWILHNVHAEFASTSIDMDLQHRKTQDIHMTHIPTDAPAYTWCAYIDATVPTVITQQLQQWCNHWYTICTQSIYNFWIVNCSISINIQCCYNTSTTSHHRYR